MIICLIVILQPLVISQMTPATPSPTLAPPIQPSRVIGGADPGFISGAPGVAVDSQGNVYVADYYNHRIQKFDSQGNFLSQFSDCKDGNFSPLALAVNNTSHSLYAVTDQTGVQGSCSPAAFPVYNIVQFDFNGTVIHRWVTCSPNGCPNPASSLTLDSHGIVYVTTYWAVCGGCSPNTELFKFSQNGQLLQRIDLTPTVSSYSYITALTTHGNYLYAVESNPAYVRGGICTHTMLTNCRVHKLTLDGTPVDGFGNTTATLYSGGIQVDALGNIYASNTTDNAIMRFAANGTALGQMGSFGQGHMQFFSPSEIGQDQNGQFYVADNANDRIQIFDKNWNFLNSIGKTTLHQITDTVLPEYGAKTGVYVADQPPGVAMRISELDPQGNLILRFYVDNYVPYTYAYTPQSIAVNPDNGTIYVAYTQPGLTGGQYSQIFAIQPNPVTILGDPRMGYGFGGTPSVAVDSQGFVYGWSGSDQVVHKYNSHLTAEISNWFPYPPDSNNYGGAIAVDSMGNIYLTNGYHNRISIYTNTGVFLSTLTPPGGAGNTIALDQSDNIFLPSATINNITQLRRTSSNTLDRVSSFNTTYRTIGIAIDQQGTIYSGEIISGAGGAVSPIYEYQSQAIDSPPTVAAILDRSTAYRGDNVTISITAVDPDGTIAGIRVDWGDGSIDQLTSLATTDKHSYSKLGGFSVIANVTDETGQVGTASASITIIDKPPTATLNSVSPSPATTNSRVTVAFSANDPDGTISSISVKWGDGTSEDALSGAATSDTHTYTAAGTFRINVTATDNDGSVSAPASALLIVQSPVQIPSVTINDLSPNPADTGATVTLTFTISSTVTVTGIVVNWGDGSSADTLAASAISDTHIFTSTNSLKSKAFTVTVSATNTGGTGHGQAIQTVNDRPPNVTVNSVTPNPTTGQTVTLSFYTTDPDGTVSSIAIDWGDSSASETIPNTASSGAHSYSTMGRYTITVRVIDDSGNSASVSSAIAVSQPPALVKCGEDDTCTVRSNSTITSADADRNRLRLTVTGNAGTIGFANVTIPRKSVPNLGKLRVTVNGAQLANSATTITSNSTDYFVYFTFTFHSPVDIIVEFNPAGNTILGLDPTLFYTIPASIAIVAIGVVAGLLRRRRRRANSM